METRPHSRDISDGSHTNAAWGHMDSSLNTVSSSLARSIRSLLQALSFQRNRTTCATHGPDIQPAVPDSGGQVCVLAYLLVKLLKNVLSPELRKQCKDWSRSPFFIAKCNEFSTRQEIRGQRATVRNLHMTVCACWKRGQDGCGSCHRLQ